MLLTAVLIISVLSLVVSGLNLAALDYLFKFVKASDSVLQDEIGLVRGDISVAQDDAYGWHRHTIDFLGRDLLINEVFPKLGIPKEPPVPLSIQMQKRAICGDEGLRKHFNLSPEVAAKIISDLDAAGVPELPWNKGIVSGGSDDNP